MAHGLEYGWAEPVDETEIQAFLALTFGHDSIQANPGRLRWLYFDNPLGLHISLCRSQGKIVGCCGHLPKPVNIENMELIAGFGIDFMIAPSWRRHGLGKHLLEMRLDRFDLSLSIGQSPSMAGLYRAMGFLDLGALKRGVHRQQFSLSKNPKVALRNLATWWRGKRSRKLSDDVRLEPSTLDQVFSKMTHSSELQENWTRWRYGGNIYSDYYCKEVHLGGQSIGFFFGRIESDNNIIVGIVGPLKNRLDLLAASVGLNPGLESRILFAGQNLEQDCRKAGFFLRPHGARLIGYSKDSSLMEAMKSGNLDLMAEAADADLLRPPTLTP